MSDKLQQTLESTAQLDFRAHCETDTTQERCGLFVLRDGLIEFVPCDNHAFDTRNSFLIHPKDFVRCATDGEVIAVGHSHVTVSAQPSNEDRVNSENCQLPFFIFQPITGECASYVPTGSRMSLIGRSWRLGVSDCYTLVRDYYAEQGVILLDYVRNDEKCLRSESMFMEHYSENGFVDMTGDTPKLHDVLLINVLANVPNHAAVYVGDGKILHHLQGRLSCHEPYGGYWQRHMTRLMRHKTWL